MAQIVNPFLRGQYAQQDQNMRQEQGQLAQLQAVAGLMDQQQTAPLKRDLLRAQIADAEQRPDDRVMMRENTKQIALARLQQAAGQAQQTHQYRMSTLTRQVDRDAETARHHLEMEAVSREHAAISGNNSRYNTGLTTPGVSRPVAPAPVAAPTGQLAGLMDGRPPAEQAALAQAVAAGSAPVRADVGQYNPATQVMQPGGYMPTGSLAALQPAPQTAPQQPIDVPTSMMPTPASLSVQQSGGLEGRFPPVGANGTPAPIQAAAVTAPAAPAAAPGPQMPQFTGSPRQIADAQNRWRSQQSKDTGGAADFTADALNMRAEQYLSGNPQAMANLGRGAQGAERIIQISNRAAELLRERGGSPQEIGRRIAEYRANSASLAQQTKSYDAITAFEQTAVRNGELLKELANKVDTTGMPVIERWIRAGRKDIAGDEDVAKFSAQLQVYRTEAARILTNPNLTGQLTDSARKEVEEFLKPGASARQITGVVDLLKRDFENRRNTLENQINTTRDRIQRNVGPSSATSHPGGRSTDQPGAVLRFDAQGNPIQ